MTNSKKPAKVTTSDKVTTLA